MELLLAIVLVAGGHLALARAPLPGFLTQNHDLTVDNCGVSNTYYTGDKIVGGRDALVGEFPWQVSLRRKSWFGTSHICGATVLNENLVVTAAHCVSGGKPTDYELTMGLHKQGDKGSHISTHKVSAIVVHESYNDYTFQNDIALLKLATPINIGASQGRVNGICLPTPGQDTSGIVTVTGWGATREGGSAADTLQAVDVPVISDANCRKAYGTSSIADSMICAGLDQGGKDSCQGDSGGPLIQRGNGKATLVAVVSWGKGCARPNLPGVYTKVSHFINWIFANA